MSFTFLFKFDNKKIIFKYNEFKLINIDEYYKYFYNISCINLIYLIKNNLLDDLLRLFNIIYKQVINKLYNNKQQISFIIINILNEILTYYNNNLIQNILKDEKIYNKSSININTYKNERYKFEYNIFFEYKDLLINNYEQIYNLIDVGITKNKTDITTKYIKYDINNINYMIDNINKSREQSCIFIYICTLHQYLNSSYMFLKNKYKHIIIIMSLISTYDKYLIDITNLNNNINILQKNNQNNIKDFDINNIQIDNLLYNTENFIKSIKISKKQKYININNITNNINNNINTLNNLKEKYKNIYNELTQELLNDKKQNTIAHFINPKINQLKNNLLNILKNIQSIINKNNTLINNIIEDIIKIYNKKIKKYIPTIKDVNKKQFQINYKHIDLRSFNPLYIERSDKLYKIHQPNKLYYLLFNNMFYIYDDIKRIDIYLIIIIYYIYLSIIDNIKYKDTKYIIPLLDDIKDNDLKYLMNTFNTYLFYYNQIKDIIIKNQKIYEIHLYSGIHLSQKYYIITEENGQEIKKDNLNIFFNKCYENKININFNCNRIMSFTDNITTAKSYASHNEENKNDYTIGILLDIKNIKAYDIKFINPREKEYITFINNIQINLIKPELNLKRKINDDLINDNNIKYYYTQTNNIDQNILPENIKLDINGGNNNNLYINFKLEDIINKYYNKNVKEFIYDIINKNINIIYCPVIDKQNNISFSENIDIDYILEQNNNYINSQLEIQDNLYKEIAYEEYNKLQQLLNNYNLIKNNEQKIISNNLNKLNLFQQQNKIKNNGGK